MELKLLQKIEELEKEIRSLKGETSLVPTYQYSKIRDKELNEIVEIKRIINKNEVFDDWFNANIIIDNETSKFLENLIKKEGSKLSLYNEEELKVFFLSQIINRIDFEDLNKNIRGFFENTIIYKTDKFILSGTVDFFVSKGLETPKIPYFFLQEFKREEEYSNPRPQLLAELISAVELNRFTSIRGAYIIGSIWNFVILEKIGENKYQYYVSINYDSTKLEDLKGIYKNLLFVKQEIFQIVEYEDLTKEKG